MGEKDVDLTRSKEPNCIRYCVIDEVHEPHYVVVETSIPGSRYVTVDYNLFYLYDTPSFKEGDVLEFHYRNHLLVKITISK